MSAITSNSINQLNINIKKYETLEGWCSVDKAIKLYNLCRNYKPFNFTADGKFNLVEIGVFGAKSLIPLSLGFLDNKNINKSINIYGLDTYTVHNAIEGTNTAKDIEWWSTNVNYENIRLGAENNLLDFKCGNQVNILKLSSLLAHKLFDPNEIDVLHQDGNHSSEITTKEVDLWSIKMKPGSLWILSAADWQSTERSKLLLKSKNFILEQDHKEFQVYVKQTIKRSTTENTKIEENFLINENWLST